jgi:hypothetical protein
VAVILQTSLVIRNDEDLRRVSAQHPGYTQTRDVVEFGARPADLMLDFDATIDA